MTIRTHIALTEETVVEVGVQIRPTDPITPTGPQIWINTSDNTIKYGVLGTIVAKQGDTGIQGFTGSQGGTGSQGVTGPFGGPQGSTGVSGSQGTTGVQGPQGNTGPFGQTGVGQQGNTGSQGNTGLSITGPQGVTGYQGPQGLTGITGNTGLDGPAGQTGPFGGPQGQTGYGGNTGLDGPQGTTGVPGSTGLRGPTGLIGSTGLRGTTGPSGGDQGETGLQGPKGDTGFSGSQGITGLQGYTGPAGAPQGLTGLQGATGLLGAQGVQGTQGSTGPQGTTGALGPTGIGSTGLPGSQGSTGPYGFTGTQGPTGVPGSTGPSGGPQGVTGVGPQGATGLPGPTGGQGAPGAQGIGITGPQGLTGTQGVTGPFGAPQGDTGPQGLTGQQGATGPYGSPPGDTGLQGPTGLRGPTGFGFTGPQGVPGMTGPQGVTGPYGAPQGFTGLPGSTGPQGATGLRGATGTVGVQGQVGYTGVPGSTGPQGITGLPGISGNTGLLGPQGSTGAQGQTGFGIQGSTGFAGATGAFGGPPGETGLFGVTGSQGVQGQTGFGLQGVTGLLGFTGLPGATGLLGPQGATGALGATGFIGPTGWQGTTGQQGFTGLQGIQGNLGPTGVSGSTGINGAFALSTVAQAELGLYTQDQIFYVTENETFYRYEQTSSATRDGTYVLNVTNPVGRLLAVSGRYFYNESNMRLSLTVNNPAVNSLVLTGGGDVLTRLKIDRGTIDTNQYTEIGWGTYTTVRANVPLSGAQTSLSFVQRGSDSTRIVGGFDTAGAWALGINSSGSSDTTTANTIQARYAVPLYVKNLATAGTTSAINMVVATTVIAQWSASTTNAFSVADSGVTNNLFVVAQTGNISIGVLTANATIDHNLYGHLHLGTSAATVVPNSVDFRVVGNKKSSIVFSDASATSSFLLMANVYSTDGSIYKKTTTSESGVRLMLTKATSVTDVVFAVANTALAGAADATIALIQHLALQQNGVFLLSNQDDSTSTSSGCLVASGGLGVAKSLYIGTNLTALGTSSLGTTTPLLVSTVGVTTVQNETDSISISTGSLIIKGGLGVAKSLYVGINLRVMGTTDALSSSTGSLVTSGGIGVGKAVYIQTNLTALGITSLGNLTALTVNANGVLTVQNVTASISTITGCALFNGGIGVSGAIYSASVTSASVTGAAGGALNLYATASQSIQFAAGGASAGAHGSISSVGAFIIGPSTPPSTMHTINGGVQGNVNTLTANTNFIVDYTKGNYQQISTNTGITISAPSAPASNGVCCNLVVTSTSGGTITVTLSGFKSPGAITSFTIAAGKYALISVVSMNSTTILCSFITDLS